MGLMLPKELRRALYQAQAPRQMPEEAFRLSKREPLVGLLNSAVLFIRGQTYDLVQRRFLSVTVDGTDAYSRAGSYNSQGHSQDHAYMTTGIMPATPSGQTDVIVATPLATADTGYLISPNLNKGNAASLIYGFQSGAFNVYGGTYTTATASDTQIDISGVGVTDCVAYAADGSTVQGYRNGAQVCDVTQTTNAEMTRVANAAWRYGSRYPTIPRDEGNKTNVIVHAAFHFNRPLTQAEAEKVTADPFGVLLEPTNDAYYFPTAAAPPSSTIPIFMHHYRQMRAR